MISFSCRILKVVVAGIGLLVVAGNAPAQTVNCPHAPNRVKVKVTSEATFDPINRLYTYAYALSSDPSSEQEVEDFFVDFVPPVLNPKAPKGWSKRKVSFRNTFHWGALEVADPDVMTGTAEIPRSIVAIKPGKSLDGFSFQSPNPPGVMKYYVAGFVDRPPVASEEEAENMAYDCPELGHLIDMAVVGTTNAPAASSPGSPDIKLLGDAAMTVEACTPYVDPGATAHDSKEGDLTSRIVVTGSVDEGKQGSYTLRYNVSNTAGIAGTEVIRTVHVRDSVAPRITEEVETRQSGSEEPSVMR